MYKQVLLLNSFAENIPIYSDNNNFKNKQKNNFIEYKKKYLK
jgi:hypothetical protein